MVIHDIYYLAVEEYFETIWMFFMIVVIDQEARKTASGFQQSKKI